MDNFLNGLQHFGWVLLNTFCFDYLTGDLFILCLVYWVKFPWDGFLSVKEAFFISMDNPDIPPRPHTTLPGSQPARWTERYGLG